MSKWLFIISLFSIFSCTSNSGKDKQILFWCSNNNQEIKLCTDITNEWNANHPGNSIHIQPIPEGQSSEEVILAAVVGKTTPDIYANMWQGNVEMYAHAGVLIPLDTLKGFMDFIKQRCDSAAIKEITSPDSHIYQVPWKVNPIMTIYNKNLFKSNNINSLPKTYSSYDEAAELFKNNSNQRGLMESRFGYTEVKAIWYQRLFNFYPLYLAASDGAPLIANNKAAFNNKYAIEVFAFLQNLYTKGYFSRESSSASSDPFVGQTIATKWTGPWEIPYLNNIPDRGFDFDYYPPIVPDDHNGNVYTYSDPKNIVLFNSCKNPQVAWDFLETLLDKKGDLELLTVTGQLPRRKGLDSDPFYTKYFNENPMMLPFAKEIPYAKGVDNCEVIVEVLDIISQEYEACVVYGKKTPEKAIADAEAAVNVLLKKRKRIIVKDELNIGIIGAGGFAMFAAKAFLQIPGIKIIAIADINKAAAENMANELNATIYSDINIFLANDTIDLVYIATPPFLHYEQSKMALLAGKHVICEKPAGLKTSEAEELQSLALSLDRLYVVNLMQRYNPLYSIVKNIVRQNLIGNFLHGFFENYASDENLHAYHWFWNENKSGGIFIEHGVHFFDMFSGWLGEGKVVNALQLQRSSHSTNKIIDRVQATVLYDKGIVNFYHGFDQPIILDRQEMRLQFEHGEITLYGWVPVEMKLHALLQKEQLLTIKSMMHNFSIITKDENINETKKVKGRFNDIVYNEEVTMEYGNITDKTNRYIEILQLMLNDQWAWIKDHNHARIIDDKNAVRSLQMAEEATAIAQKF